ncbi:MAG: transglutaminase family protein [Chitinophagaceae bacterium]
MPVYTIHHVTKYEYDRLIKESCNEIKIYPYSSSDQEIIEHTVQITNYPDVFVFKDYFGNRTGVFNVLPLHNKLIIESKLTIRTKASAIAPNHQEASWHDLSVDVKNNFHLFDYLKKDTIINEAAIQQIIYDLQASDKPIAAVIEAASHYVFSTFKYVKGITSVETTVDEILEVKAGVCQDFAHVLLQILRSLNIPCRYVSGYICPNKNGLRGEGATHAWIDAYIPTYGWAGIDPTNDVWVTDNHIKLAVGKHFADCTPVKGTFKGPAKQQLSVYVSVGYEDGHIFEDVNNINMEFTPTVPVKKEHFVIDTIVQQQQQ